MWRDCLKAQREHNSSRHKPLTTYWSQTDAKPRQIRGASTFQRCWNTQACLLLSVLCKLSAQALTPQGSHPAKLQQSQGATAGAWDESWHRTHGSALWGALIQPRLSDPLFQEQLSFSDKSKEPQLVQLAPLQLATACRK